MRFRQFLSATAGLLVAAAVVILTPPEARAAEEVPASRLRLEGVGVELLPVSLNAGSFRAGSPSPGRFLAGEGGTLRFLTLQWTNAYWTPVVAGIFRAGGKGADGTVLWQVVTEGGVRLPVGKGTLELGAGLGLGLANVYPGYCNGDCAIPGVGLILSPVARYRLR